MMRSRRDPDLVLVEAMLAPPPLEDARSSLAYWQERRRRLPVYQRSARREAREMAARWEGRVHEAELLRFESTVAGRILKAVGLVLPLRATEREEALGMDVVEHGEEAYTSGEGAILVAPDARVGVEAQLARL